VKKNREEECKTRCGAREINYYPNFDFNPICFQLRKSFYYCFNSKKCKTHVLINKPKLNFTSKLNLPRTSNTNAFIPTKPIPMDKNVTFLDFFLILFKNLLLCFQSLAMALNLKCLSMKWVRIRKWGGLC